MTDAAHLRATGRIVESAGFRSTAALGAERRATLLQILTRAANTGAPMPSTKDLGDVLAGRHSNPAVTVSLHLAGLVKSGDIEIVYGATQYDRRVKILATGKLTGWQARQDGRSPSAARPVSPTTKLPGRYSGSRALAGGFSDLVLYGALAESVRFCRSRGDTVHRDEHNNLVILINGRPGDPKARAEWHRRMRP